MKKVMKVAVVVVTVAALGTGGYFALREPPASERTAGRVVRVERGELIETADASGRIEPHVQVEVKSRTSGEVIEVLVQEGQSVDAGAVLFRLDPIDAEGKLREAQAAARRSSAEVAQARANAAIALVEEEAARTTREVSTRGTELGVVSTESDRGSARQHAVAQATLALRRAQVSAATASLGSSRVAVEESERRLRETEIRAPIAGTILSVAVERGSIVASAVTNVGGGSALAMLADLSDLRVVGKIDEAQIGRVAVGQVARVRVDAYPDRTFAARVETVSPLGTEVSNVVTFDVEIVVTDRDANLLRSGMSADVEIETGRSAGVLLLPLVAVRTATDGRYVRLANGERRTIRTGATDGSQIVVLSGLREGDSVRVGGDEAPAAPAAGGSPFGRPPSRRRM